jgi:outer membrane protein assembly factor BamB
MTRHDVSQAPEARRRAKAGRRRGEVVVRMVVTLGWLGLWPFRWTEVDAAEWPQWRGARRDGSSTETGLLRTWPQAGPTLLWSAAGAGPGYSLPAVAGGRVYVTGRVGEQEKLSAFTLDGRPLWERAYGKAWMRSFSDARSTPTVVGDLVYVISGMGEVACLEAGSGRIRWSIDALMQFAGRPGPWGSAESPLIVDDKLIYTPAGPMTTVVALDRHSAKTVWTGPTLDHQGVRHGDVLMACDIKAPRVAAQ